MFSGTLRSLATSATSDDVGYAENSGVAGVAFEVRCFGSNGDRLG